MARPTVMTPELETRAWELLEAGASRLETARALGISPQAVSNWARRVGRKFADGRLEARRTEPSDAFLAAARRNAALASAAATKARTLPLSEAERRAYRALRNKARICGIRVSRDDAFAAIGRADLVGWGA